MIITPHWSALDHAILTLPPHIDALDDDTARWLAVAASVASEDGVYSLEELLRELKPPELPDAAFRVLRDLEGGHATLDDLRAALRTLAENETFMDGPECVEGEDDVECDCRACVVKRREASVRAQAYFKEREAERKRKEAASNYALVSIERVKVYLPDEVSPDDEDAVRAWVRENAHRVRQAAQDSDADDLTVYSVRRAAS